MSIYVKRMEESDLIPREHGPYGTWVNPLSPKFGAEELGFRRNRLLAGRFSGLYHAHLQQEELLIPLQGRAWLRHKDGFEEVMPGQLLFFPKGKEHCHQLYNPGPEPFDYLALANHTQEETCYYPDSGKEMTLTRSQDIHSPSGGWVMQQGFDYFKGEMEPERFWPPEILQPRP